ncbi:MAG: glycosyltransferase [Anaerolineae bacterium]|nr:glycosyltransferase [Gloeobacterales cyanobacterium ES-bin-313]
MPQVSVIIPAYNALKYLPETINSVLAQSFVDYEIIVVDDESTDGTAEWLRSRASGYLHFYEQKNQGAAAARNTAIRHARGKYIAFLDADDLWEPTMLEQQVACLEEHPEAGLVYTWMRVIDENGKPTGNLCRPKDEGFIWEQLVRTNNIYPSATMVRRGCFDTVGLFDPELPNVEDWDMWLRIANRYPVVVLREPLMLYRRHPNCNSKKTSERVLLRLLDKIFDHAPEHLLALKAECFGRNYLYLAWKALERGDIAEAWDWRRQALAKYPPLLWYPSGLRFVAAMAVRQYLSADIYREFAIVARKLRSILTLN